MVHLKSINYKGCTWQNRQNFPKRLLRTHLTPQKNYRGRKRWFLGRRTTLIVFICAFAAIGTITLLFTIAASAAGPIKGIGGKCLDNNGNHLRNRNKIQLYGCNGTVAQQWTVNSNGTPIWLYACNGTAAQRWLVPKYLYRPRRPCHL